MRGRDKIMMSWIAPRGIVAAATAGIFGPELLAAGYQDAEILLPIVFLVIVVTVLAHGLTLGPLAQRMDLADGLHQRLKPPTVEKNFFQMPFSTTFTFSGLAPLWGVCLFSGEWIAPGTGRHHPVSAPAGWCFYPV